MEEEKKRAYGYARNLFQYVPHWHRPINVNAAHAQSFTSINDKIALTVTKLLGTMWAAYLFLLLAILGFPGFHATPQVYVQYVSQTVIQLVALAVLGNGQQIADRHTQLRSDEQFNFIQKSYDDTEQMKQHLLRIEAKIGGENSEPTAKEAATIANAAPFNAINPSNPQQP